MKHYPRLSDALADGMRLAEAMSLKFASVDFPHGGGKAVIALPTPEIPQGAARRRLLREYGAFVNSLGGLYSAAPDMNTSALDMDVIAEVTPFVFCRTEASGGSGDTAPDTAVGVFHGIRAACRHAFDSDDLSLRRILVQGAGGVGGHLIDLLMEADATVMATDVDERRLAALREKGIQVVAPESALTTQCDVLAPCAVGGIINARSIPRLRCRVIAGGANNQLERPEDADLLRERAPCDGAPIALARRHHEAHAALAILERVEDGAGSDAEIEERRDVHDVLRMRRSSGRAISRLCAHSSASPSIFSLSSPSRIISPSCRRARR